VVAGGTESMSLVPMGGNKIAPNPALVDSVSGRVPEHRPGGREPRARVGISREEQDAFALRSHQRAVAAIDAGGSRTRSCPLTVRTVDTRTGTPPGRE
jgi:acetyl-CoA acyltransferase